MTNSSKTGSEIPEIDLSHSMVHYLLTIHKLKETKGYARVTDIAKELGLTKGSVSTSINNLKKKGYVQEEEDSKFLLLTQNGHDEVHRILSSRTLLFYFLRDFVGVDSETARRDACLMEHLMSAQTSQKFFNFMKNLACSCDEETKSHASVEFKTALDLCQFSDAKEFIESQEGDSYLVSDH